VLVTELGSYEIDGAMNSVWLHSSSPIEAYAVTAVWDEFDFKMNTGLLMASALSILEYRKQALVVL
jgi:hypothetical protein